MTTITALRSPSSPALFPVRRKSERVPAAAEDPSTPPLPPRSRRSPVTLAAAAPQPVDPPFMPAGFDMGAAVEAMKGLLIAQGVRSEMLKPGKVQHTWATDFDGTLGRSQNIPVFLRAKTDVIVDGKVVMKAGDYFKDPAGNDLMLHGLTGKDVAQDLADLKAAYPDLPWAFVQQDWSAFDNRAVAMKTPLESFMVRRLKGATKREAVTASFIISARTQDDVAGGMHQALRARNVDVWGVILTGTKSVQDALGLAQPNMTDGQRKAIVQMILLHMLAPKTHTWRDDSPSNSGRAIDSLAAKFPTIAIRIYDAIHTGKNTSSQRLIARSNGRGQFVDPKSREVWTLEKTAAHDNQPLPLLPRLTPAGVARR